MPYVIQHRVKQKLHLPGRTRSRPPEPRRPWGFFGPKTKRVKNLAWLLAHRDEVVGFEAVSWPEPDGCAAGVHDPDPPGVMMVAHLAGGDVYLCKWGSMRLMEEWLHRPSFRGLPLQVDGTEDYC